MASVLPGSPPRSDPVFVNLVVAGAGPWHDKSHQIKGQASCEDWRRPRQAGIEGPLISVVSLPSGIGTYSQAGAQFGYGIGWTMLLTFPLMAAIQEISARVGRVTGHGIAGNVRQHNSSWLLQVVVTLLFIANTINIGADLGGMADATRGAGLGLAVARSLVESHGGTIEIAEARGGGSRVRIGLPVFRPDA